MDTHPFYPEEKPDPQPGAGEPPLLERYAHLKPYFWQGKIGPAFWTIGGLFSLTLNVILIIALVLIGRELFNLKTVINDQLINGLAENFALMDQAVIATTVNVEDTIPVQFTLPVQAETTVILTADTLLQNANVSLSTGGLRITDAPTDIILKAGTELPVNLDILVPVDTTVPVELVVEVEIPSRTPSCIHPSSVCKMSFPLIICSSQTRPTPGKKPFVPAAQPSFVVLWKTETDLL